MDNGYSLSSKEMAMRPLEVSLLKADTGVFLMKPKLVRKTRYWSSRKVSPTDRTPEMLSSWVMGST